MVQASISAKKRQMPRYYFQLQADGHDAADKEGIEFVDLPTARDHARRALADILRDEVAEGSDIVALAIAIHDAAGYRVAKISAVLTIA